MVRGIPRGVVRKIDTLPDTDAPPLNTQNLRNENFIITNIVRNKNYLIFYYRFYTLNVISKREGII